MYKLNLMDSLAGGLAAAGLFAAGALVTRAVRMEQVRTLIASIRQRGREAPVVGPMEIP